jgi:hypothetical protein
MKLPKMLDEWAAGHPLFSRKTELPSYSFKKKDEEFTVHFTGGSDRHRPFIWYSSKKERCDEIDPAFKGLYFTLNERYFDQLALKAVFHPNRKRGLDNLYYCHAFCFGDERLLKRLGSNPFDPTSFSVDAKYQSFIVNLKGAIRRLGHEVEVTHTERESHFKLNIEESERRKETSMYFVEKW